MYLECCGRRNTADIYVTAPTLGGAVEQIVLFSKSCKNCGKPILVIHGLDYDGNSIKPVRVKSKNAISVLDSLDIIWKPDRLKVPTGSHGWYLCYQRFGAVQKCRSNLSSLRDGLVPALDEDSNVRRALHGS